MTGDPDDSLLAPHALARRRAHAAWLEEQSRAAFRRKADLCPRDGDVADVFGHWQALVQAGLFGRGARSGGEDGVGCPEGD